MPRERRRVSLCWVPLLLTCCLLVSGCSGGGDEAEGPFAGRGEPAEGASGGSRDPFRSTAPPGDSGFVENQTCAGCHQAEFEAWMGSDHQLAMQVADETSVLGDFDDASIIMDGVTTRFFRRDGGFWVNTAGADGIYQDFKIDYVFGVRPLQQYLVALPGGRLQCLVATWDDVGKRWYDLYPDETIKPGDPYHWTGNYQNWNLMCAECHSTDLRENFDSGTDSYDTTWAEINVSCQACHGPGNDHVQWAGSDLPADIEPGGKRGLLVDYATGDSVHEVETCAPCHARRHRVSGEDAHGRPFQDDFMPSLLRQGLYHDDGQILEEVYVYSSFVQSPMYREGVRCSDCHDPHSLKLKAEGDAVCTSCHQDNPDPRFPTLRSAVYDDPEHHRHGEGSPGTACVACHMPATNYMVVDPRRDHSMRVPRPDLSVKLGTPNPCTGCHEEETDVWAAQTVAGWYPRSQHRGVHFGEALHKGRKGDRDAGPDLVAVAEDEGQPGIVRATALDLLGHYPEGAPVLLAALEDPDPTVRATALHALDRLPPEDRVTYIAPLLRDPVRSVRIEAARSMASVPATDLSADQIAARRVALDELMDALEGDADTPGAHLNMGTLAASQGQADLAVEAYLQALKMEPGFLPARFNLANLYNAMGRNGDAEQILRDGIILSPHEGELFYSLGLLLAEDRHYQEAAGALGSAVELMPERSRVHYNYALVVQALGDPETAEAALLAAYNLDHDDLRTVHALGVFYADRQRWERARPFADRLVNMAPEHPATQDLVARVTRGLQHNITD
jgi:predicted CXXCH cytochrome family protein